MKIIINWLYTQKLFNFTKESADDIATFISKLQAVVTTIKGSWRNDFRQHGGNKNFRNLSISQLHGSRNLQTIENLTSRLVMEEERIKSEQQEVNEALLAKKFRRKFSRNSSSKTGKWHVCDQFGHWKNECPKIKIQHQVQGRIREIQLMRV